ncbi:PQQ-binding-like beta-propeller repeat protein [Arthrobacter sp. ok362]|uniref:outer membrane protein assembly factor BamB family protein n=1 Tax=Arthrobacter sp. ok362 TaxID=1761745 RepID=UPI000B80E71D|nr:PQQ-binding-like beta-propeller repeat protein [Arthrobacter sp. ok362]
MYPPSVVGRRSFLSLAAAVGAGAALSVGNNTTTASVPANSLDAINGTEVPLSIVGTEPSAVLRRYANVFRSGPNPTALFFRNRAGALKLVAACRGLAGQVQVIDASTGKLELSSTPFPGAGGGAVRVVYEPSTGALFAFGPSAMAKRVSLAGLVSDAYGGAPGTTSVAFAPAVDSKGRIWSGNYPLGSATRFDPSTRQTIHTPRVHAGVQYVRCLAIDTRDNVYAGTGVLNPRIVTWHTDSPMKLREIAIPGAAAKGFVFHIAAHPGVLFVHYEGAGSKELFRVYDLETATWKTLPWTWSPAMRLSAALPAGGDIYAIRNTAGVFELIRIDARSMAAEAVCVVPGAPRAMSIEMSSGDTILNVLCGVGQQHDYVKVSVTGKRIVQTVHFGLADTPLRVQALAASASGTTMYLGAYMGDGIASVDLVSRATWRSATDTGIAQIEGMYHYDDSTIYVGSYTRGRLFRFNPRTRSVIRLIELRDVHLQSRPFAWTQAAGKVVAGTVAEYGYNTGAMAIINPLNNSDITVISGPIPGQSVLGLVGEGDIVYGTTGIKGGYGSVDDTKPAHVFAWNVRQNRLVWKKPLPGEVELNSPLVVRGILYVSTNNGVIRLNKATGSLVFTYKLLNRSPAPGYKTSEITYLPQCNSIVHFSGGTATVLDMESRTRKEILRGTYSDMVATSRGRLYFVEDGTNIVEIDAVQKPTIHTAADLVTVGADGWLYVARSVGSGKYAKPIRAASGFGSLVRSCHAVDWNGDGVLDVLTSNDDGTLHLHRGLREGGFAVPTRLAASGWHNRQLAVGIWGAELTVVSADNSSGQLLAWPVLASGAVGKPVSIGSGWRNKQMVMLVPSRTLASALIVNENGSLYRYSRGAGGKISTAPVRLSAGGFSYMTAFSPIVGHKTDHNGIAGIDASGAVKYTDVAPNSVGIPLSYAFGMKSYKFASG